MLYGLLFVLTYGRRCLSPPSWAPRTFDSYRPWLDETDPDEVRGEEKAKRRRREGEEKGAGWAGGWVGEWVDGVSIGRCYWMCLQGNGRGGSMTCFPCVPSIVITRVQRVQTDSLCIIHVNRTTDMSAFPARSSLALHYTCTPSLHSQY